MLCCVYVCVYMCICLFVVFICLPACPDCHEQPVSQQPFNNKEEWWWFRCSDDAALQICLHECSSFFFFFFFFAIIGAMASLICHQFIFVSVWNNKNNNANYCFNFCFWINGSKIHVFHIFHDWKMPANDFFNEFFDIRGF